MTRNGSLDDAGRAAVAIADVAGRADALRALGAVDVDAHHAVGEAPRQRDVVPAAVGDVDQPADRLLASAAADAEGDAAAGQRDAVLAVVAGAEHVAIEDHVAVGPAVAAGLAGGRRVGAGLRLQPELDGEVAAEVGRDLRIDRHLDAIDFGAWGCRGSAATCRSAGRASASCVVLALVVVALRGRGRGRRAVGRSSAHGGRGARRRLGARGRHRAREAEPGAHDPDRHRPDCEGPGERRPDPRRGERYCSTRAAVAPGSRPHRQPALGGAKYPAKSGHSARST